MRSLMVILILLLCNLGVTVAVEAEASSSSVSVASGSESFAGSHESSETVVGTVNQEELANNFPEFPEIFADDPIESNEFAGDGTTYKIAIEIAPIPASVLRQMPLLPSSSLKKPPIRQY